MRDEDLTKRISDLQKSLDKKKSTQPTGASNQIVRLVETANSFDISITETTRHLYQLTFDFNYTIDNYVYAQGLFEVTPENTTDLLGLMGGRIQAVDIDKVNKIISFMTYVAAGDGSSFLVYDYKFYVLASTTGYLDNFDYDIVSAI